MTENLVALDRQTYESLHQELQTLRASNQRLQQLTDSILGVLYQLKRSSTGVLTFLHLSAGCHLLLQLNPQQLQTDASLLLQQIHEDDRLYLEQSLQQAAQSLTPWHWEGRVYLPNGGFKWMQTIAQPQSCEDGSTLWHGWLLDITDRKQLEKQLCQSRQFLDTIVENIPLAVFVKDVNQEFRYVLWNRAAEEMYEMSRKEALGRNSYDWLEKEAADRFLAEDMQVLYTDEVAVIEDIFTHQSGREIHQRLLKAPLFDQDGHPSHILCIAEDVSERKQAEAALRESEERLRQQAHQLEQVVLDLQRTQAQLVQTEKMSSLGQLVAGIAHEINNPINFIHGNLEPARRYTQDLLEIINLYQSENPNPSAAIADLSETVDLEFIQQDLPKLLVSMKGGTERIREIVRSLRTFSRLDEADVKAVDLHECLDSTLVILSHRLRANHHFPGIQIVKQYGSLPRVECYPGQLNQVFMNILSNAIDALEERMESDETAPSDRSTANPPDLILTIRTEYREDSRVLIAIADNGVGISESVQKRIFDPFFTTKPVGKGTGMGMAISYQIITERHKGFLTCHSVQGQGTEFIVDIPSRLGIKDP